MDRISAYKKTMSAADSAAENPKDSDWLTELAEFDRSHAPRFDKALPPPADTKTDADGGIPDGQFPAFLKVSERPLSKRQRLGRFLALIDRENAERILDGLPKHEAVILRKEVEELRGIEIDGRICGMTSLEARQIYEEFKEILSAPPPPHKALAFLEEFAPEQVALLLHKESPQTCAVVLARLPPKLAAGSLKFFEKEKKQDVVFRIARLGPVSPEIIAAIADTLRGRVRELGPPSPGEAVDGVAALAEILKNADISFGDKIIENLADEDPLLARTLKERLYTADDVCRAEDRPIAEKLETMPEKDIALLIRGRPESFAEKILSNISAGRRALVRDEDQIMGAVLKADADAALKDFLQWFRDKREKGELLFIDDETLI
jgi:flagellar motor switch protein FliG